MRPTEAGADVLVTTPAPTSADERVLHDEAERERKSVDHALSHALERLPPEDRLIVRMRFWENMSVANIARGLGLPQKPLYRRIEHALTELRKSLEASGISWAEVESVLEHRTT